MVQDAIAYVESLSNEELEKLDSMFQAKELEFIEKEQNQKLAKVYIKENNHQ